MSPNPLQEPSAPIRAVTPYHFPPHLDLYAEEQVIEAELIEDTEVARYRPAPEVIIDAEVVEDPAELEAGADLGSAEVPVPPPDVETQKPELPEGVRVAWKRPTELFAEVGARVSARGMDFTAALSERVTGRSGQVPQTPREGGWRLAPMNPFGQEPLHRSMPEPDTIFRG